jgi:crossover junction endodeoxyribonuclease RuvC
MVILGIDPGSKITGYAFLRKGSSTSVIQVLEYGAIKVNSGQELMPRLGQICAELELRILEHKPKLLAMESSFYALNVKTTLVLGHVRGAIMALCARFGMGFAEYSPRSIKQAVTGTGAADKSRVARMIQLHLKLETISTNEDASDALAVAWTYLSPTGIQHELAKFTSKSKSVKQKKQTSPMSLPNSTMKSSGLAVNALPPGTDLESILRNARKRKRK